MMFNIIKNVEQLYINANDQTEEQLLNSIYKYYYRDLYTLTVEFGGEISFMKFQEFISNSSSLDVLKIDATHIRDLAEFFKNKPEELIFRDMDQIRIILIQIDSYRNVKSLWVHTISLTDTAEIIKGLTTLKTFYCNCIVPEAIDGISHKESVTNESMQMLEVPLLFFFQTKRTYHFPNLKNLHIFNNLPNNTSLELGCQKLNRNIGHKDLEYIDCPQLEKICIDFDNIFDHNNSELHIKSIKNILSYFPNIVTLICNDSGDLLCNRTYIPISDEELSDIIKSCPRLRFVDCFCEYENRIERLRSRL